MKWFPFLFLVTIVTSGAIASEGGQTRWGAIALGGNGFGAARGRLSEDAATSGALRQCEESGGAGECRIRLTYRNQCAAYAAGDDRQVGVAYADSIGKASKLALRSCSQMTRHCQVHYAACSMPTFFN